MFTLALFCGSSVTSIILPILRTRLFSEDMQVAEVKDFPSIAFWWLESLVVLGFMCSIFLLRSLWRDMKKEHHEAHQALA